MGGVIVATGAMGGWIHSVVFRSVSVGGSDCLTVLEYPWSIKTEPSVKSSMAYMREGSCSAYGTAKTPKKNKRKGSARSIPMGRTDSESTVLGGVQNQRTQPHRSTSDDDIKRHDNRGVPVTSGTTRGSFLPQSAKLDGICMNDAQSATSQGIRPCHVTSALVVPIRMA